MHPTEEVLDNALQKTSAMIRTTIDIADVPVLREVYCSLYTCKTVWNACGYDYKGRELCDRAIERLSVHKEATAPQAKKQLETIENLRVAFNKMSQEFWKAECNRKAG